MYWIMPVWFVMRTNEEFFSICSGYIGYIK